MFSFSVSFRQETAELSGQAFHPEGNPTVLPVVCGKQAQIDQHMSDGILSTLSLPGWSIPSDLAFAFGKCRFLDGFFENKIRKRG